LASERHHLARDAGAGAGKETRMSRYPALVAAAAALFAMSPALAQQDPSADYPNRPVKIIVSVPAGGGVDTVTRIFAAGLQQHLGQPFVIENRGGAGGNLGAEAVYTADPDGYTLLASQPAPITSNVALYKKLNFDPAALESVAVMSKFPNVLLVRQDFPAKTAQEFIAYAKANPDKITFASQGPGTSSHLTAELFMKLTGTKMLHVPYRGTGPALNDLVAGHVDFIFMELASAYKLHEGGKSRILAVATDHRLDILPDVPTLIELGVPGFLSDTWNAISAPPKTPAPIVSKLNRTINEILNEAATKARFRDLQLSAGGGSPQDMAKLKRDETERWSKVIREAGIQPE
jgi:tripartite-type tricarboxylate transporter receptor subunit TctC